MAVLTRRRHESSIFTPATTGTSESSRLSVGLPSFRRSSPAPIRAANAHGGEAGGGALRALAKHAVNRTDQYERGGDARYHLCVGPAKQQQEVLLEDAAAGSGEPDDNPMPTRDTNAIPLLAEQRRSAGRFILCQKTCAAVACGSVREAQEALSPSILTHPAPAPSPSCP